MISGCRQFTPQCDDGSYDTAHPFLPDSDRGKTYHPMLPENDLVKVGKVRTLGASAMYGYQFYNMQLAAREHGWATPFGGGKSL